MDFVQATLKFTDGYAWNFSHW